MSQLIGSRQNTLPNSFSLTMPAENYGEIHAQGFDLQLGYHGNNKDFSYYGNLTMSYGWNKTIKQDYAENARWIDIPVGKSQAGNLIKLFVHRKNWMHLKQNIRITSITVYHRS